MRIRHVIAVDQLDAAGFIANPRQARHALVVAGRISELAGPIDPLTHLNLDFPEHRLDECLVVERCELGAAVLRDGDQFWLARPPASAYAALGAVNVDSRRAAWMRSWKAKP